jgi:hypothetical protein
MPKMPAAGTSAVAGLHVITTPFEPNLRVNAGGSSDRLRSNLEGVFGDK